MLNLKSKWWLYIPIIILAISLIFRLIDQSKILFFFPLDTVNDMSSYMSQFYFLLKCGFHHFCPYWYNGFTTFELTPPGWYFFALPIYWLTQDIQATFFISLILIYILAFVAILYFGKLIGFNIPKRILFFLLFFGNAIAVGNFIRLGRVPELFAWLNFWIIFILTIYYKDNEIDYNIFWLIIPLSIVILSHQTITLIAFLTLFSLFLIKNYHEKIKIIICGLISLIITSFWWIPYLKEFSNSAGVNVVLTETLINFNRTYIPQNIATFIIPIVFCATFYIYWKSNNKFRKDLIFFLIPLILSILLFTRLIMFVPILKYIYPDIYMLYFLLFSFFFVLKTNFPFISKLTKILIKIGIIGFVISSVAVTIFYTPYFIIPGEFEQEITSSLEYVNDTFLLIGAMPTTMYHNALYSYAPIYYNLSTSGGWYTTITTPEYFEKLKSVNSYLETKDCNSLISTINYLNTSQLVTFGHYCDTLASCGFTLKHQSTNACVYTTGRINDV